MRTRGHREGSTTPWGSGGITGRKEMISWWSRWGKSREEMRERCLWNSGGGGTSDPRVGEEQERASGADKRRASRETNGFPGSFQQRTALLLQALVPEQF